MPEEEWTSSRPRTSRHSDCMQEVGEIYYVDHNGDFWDEVLDKKLDGEGARNTRLDEIEQLYAHGVSE